MPLQQDPRVEERSARPYVGARTRVTMATMVPTVPDLMPVVVAWAEAHGADLTGPPFWRYTLIQMTGELEVVPGFPIADAFGLAGSDGIEVGVLPAGRYLVTRHRGHPDELEAATADLLAWADIHDLSWDRTIEADGEHWAGRIETYFDDPAENSDMRTWVTELAFKLAD